MWSLRNRLTEIELLRLPRLIPIWDADLDDAEKVLAGLYRALEGERKRGKAGHWTYSLPRHQALWRMIKRIRSMRHESS